MPNSTNAPGIVGPFAGLDVPGLLIWAPFDDSGTGEGETT
jgi:hypothetical protein